MSDLKAQDLRRSSTIDLLTTETSFIVGGGNLNIYKSFIDVVDTGLGDDIVLTGLGEDTVNGGAGNDILIGGSSGKTFYGGSGNDEIYLS